jgi:hypothetical protein
MAFMLGGGGGEKKRGMDSVCERERQRGREGGR